MICNWSTYQRLSILLWGLIVIYLIHLPIMRKKTRQTSHLTIISVSWCVHSCCISCPIQQDNILVITNPFRVKYQSRLSFGKATLQCASAPAPPSHPNIFTFTNYKPMIDITTQACISASALSEWMDTVVLLSRFLFGLYCVHV